MNTMRDQIFNVQDFWPMPYDPPHPLTGQLWYNYSEKLFKMCDAPGIVKQVTPEAVSNAHAYLDAKFKPPGVEYIPRFGHDEKDQTHHHYHRDREGLLHKCFHQCRSLFTWQFWAGITLSFPIEHALWTKLWPFYHIARFLGLDIDHH